MKDLLGDDYIDQRYVSRLKEVNPMVLKYGQLEGDRRCKECELFTGHTRNKTWFKCKLRGITHGEGTDHRANWEACNKFRENEINSL